MYILFKCSFMAAGGSAPELFTSLMSVFVSKDDIGFGTIVGSAVFNVLFVIGLCGVFAKTTLHLTWWPLFRDCSYYIISLGVLVLFIHDGKVEAHETILLFILYLFYVLLMKYNDACKARVKNWSTCWAKHKASTSIDPALEQDTVPETRKGSLSEAQVKRVLSRVRSVAMRTILKRRLQLAVLPEVQSNAATGGLSSLSGKAKFKIATACVFARQNGYPDATIASMLMEMKENASEVQSPATTHDEDGEAADEDSESGSMFDWPSDFPSQLLFLSTFPLNVVMYCSIPNCGEPRWKRYYGLTFFMSLLWIAIFSYNMVWWSTVIAQALALPPVIMGITVLAAGTSIPDALSSVIVARKGFGDMAVSSSIGSNIFDILVGLPIPWMLKTCIIDPGTTVGIMSKTLVWSVTTLMSMVMLVILSIIYSKWQLGKTLGGIMFVLYILFVIHSIWLESLN